MNEPAGPLNPQPMPATLVNGVDTGGVDTCGVELEDAVDGAVLVPGRDPGVE